MTSTVRSLRPRSYCCRSSRILTSQTRPGGVTLGNSCTCTVKENDPFLLPFSSASTMPRQLTSWNRVPGSMVRPVCVGGGGGGGGGGGRGRGGLGSARRRGADGVGSNPGPDMNCPLSVLYRLLGGSWAALLYASSSVSSSVSSTALSYASSSSLYSCGACVGGTVVTVSDRRARFGSGAMSRKYQKKLTALFVNSPSLVKRPLARYLS